MLQTSRENDMPRTSSQERPLKRQKSCINYCFSSSIENSEEDGSTAVASPVAENSPAEEALPSKTPAVGLLPNGLPPTGLASPSNGPTTATGRRQIGTSLLQSLQRRFIHQQMLETPFDRLASPNKLEEKEEENDEDLDGFVLFSQPTYERVLSQRPAGDEVTPSSQAPTAYDDIEPAAPPPRTTDPPTNQKIEEEEPIFCSQPPVPTTTGSGPLLPVDPMALHGHTPAVHSADRVQLNSGGPSGVFPIFRSKKDCKVLHIIRHGESEYNRAIAARGSTWAEPNIFDAPLTLRGRKQASDLRRKVHEWGLPEDAVWLTSPLTRAIETMLFAFPGGPEDPYNHHTHGLGKDQLQNLYRNVYVLPEITEQLMTSGDIGRKPEDLAHQFPQLEPQLRQLPECWWYNHPQKKNCPYLGEFKASEPKEIMKKRIKAFRKWILDRPEKHFVAVGHSVFWKAFATACKNGAKQESLKNCGYMVVHV